MRISKATAVIFVLALFAAALTGCRAAASSPGDIGVGPASLTGPYSLTGWSEPARMSPDSGGWSIELPTGGWWDFPDDDPFANGVTPTEATYRTSRQVSAGGSQPYASVNIITLKSLENPRCPDYNFFTPSGERVSERLADMRLGDRTARVFRLTAPAADGSASGEFNVCLIADGVMYSINAAARPTLAQVDLFKMLRTFRLES
jgi:hypothetical protein